MSETLNLGHPAELNQQLEAITTVDAIRSLKPRDGKDRVSVAVFCNAGTNRSALYAKTLTDMGYEAKNFPAGGSSPFSPEQLKDFDPQVILHVSPRVQELYNERISKLFPEIFEGSPAPLTRTLRVPESSAIRARSHQDNPYYKHVPINAAGDAALQTLTELGFERRTSDKAKID